MERVILHVDMNNFYASVECSKNPSLWEKPVIVCGDVEKRHGIVLAKNPIAKKAGIKTGETVAEAKRKCAGLVCVAAHYDDYVAASKKARRIYDDYAFRVEPFGLDEAWLDISGRYTDIKKGEETANDIRRAISENIHITASVGVSFNKIFAKLGSDMKKPDATTVISRDNFKDCIWQLPARELLYVGRKTEEKFLKRSIRTIGDIARCDSAYLRSFLGKHGEMLWRFANGLDASEVRKVDHSREIKSVGNSTTTCRDLVCEQDIKTVLYMLSEKIASRMRKKSLKGGGVSIGVKYFDFTYFEKQRKLKCRTDLAADIYRYAGELFWEYECLKKPVRSLGVRMFDLEPGVERQLNIFDSSRQAAIETAMDGIRDRYGYHAVTRAIMLCDTGLAELEDGKRAVFSNVNFL